MKKKLSDRLSDILGSRQKLMTLEFISLCQNVPPNLIYSHSKFYNHTSWQSFLLVIVFHKHFEQHYGDKETNNGYLYFPAPSPLLGPWPWPWPPICIYRPWPPIYIPFPNPRFVFTRSGTQFVFTSPSLHYYYQSGALVLHTPTLFTQFLFVFTALV